MGSQSSEQSKGIMYSALSYMIWGILPMYWKLVEDVSSEEILAHRVFWSFLFMVGVLLVLRRWKDFWAQGKRLFHQPKLFTSLMMASVLISINWFMYIWAVNHNHIIEASLGYYVNPLVSILLGMLVLKERLQFWQRIAVGLAALGVISLAYQHGSFPWIAITLATSFGLYGLVKKLMNFDAVYGITFETLVVTPVALAYLIMLQGSGGSAFGTVSLPTTMLLIGAGAATAIPLLLFTQGAKRIPMYMTGFLQYIAPTISLCLGIFVYDEHFSKAHMMAFSFIWVALLLFTFSRTRFMISIEPKSMREKSMPS